MANPALPWLAIVTSVLNLNLTRPAHSIKLSAPHHTGHFDDSYTIAQRKDNIATSIYP